MCGTKLAYGATRSARIGASITCVFRPLAMRLRGTYYEPVGSLYAPTGMPLARLRVRDYAPTPRRTATCQYGSQHGATRSSSSVYAASAAPTHTVTGPCTMTARVTASARFTSGQVRTKRLRVGQNTVRSDALLRSVVLPARRAYAACRSRREY
eukprot:3693619-Rhodomonas_salina.1